MTLWQVSIAGLKKKQIANLDKVKTIDIALDELVKIDVVSKLTSLKTLSIVNCTVTEIEGVRSLKELEDLWLTQNQLTRMRGLSQTISLKRLFLGRNKLVKIRGLDTLVNLTTLWLDENRIDKIENLSKLRSLVELNLAGNRIETIGSGLDGLNSLESVNLSQNRIGNFKEILNLDRLPKLKSICFFDGHYGDNPICNLCNYQTYVLYHLPNLKKLDTLTISEDARSFAEATFMKKRMYYNMRIKTIQRNTSNVIKLLKCAKMIRTFKSDIISTKLNKRIYEIQRELEERNTHRIAQQEDPRSILALEESLRTILFGNEEAKSNPLDLLSQEQLLNDLDQKLTIVNGKLLDQNEEMKDIDCISQSLVKKIYEVSEQNIHRLMTELETGGNIRFEEGKPQDKWFNSCVELIQSRFTKDCMSKFGVESINVTRVTRIHNRFLRNRFEEKLEHLVDLSTDSYKKRLEYLFYGIDPKMPNEIFRAMEEGFRSVSDYQREGMPYCIPLVNSVQSADSGRIQQFLSGEDVNAHLRTANKQNKSPTGDQGIIEIPTGHILICKVFLAKSVHDTNYPNFNPDKPPSQTFLEEPFDYKYIQRQGNNQSLYRTKSDDPKQRIWMVYDNALVLPEYLIEFEYKTAQSNPKIQQIQAVQDSNEECDRLLNLVQKTQNVLNNTYIRHNSKGKENKMKYCAVRSVDLDRSELSSIKKPLNKFIKQCCVEELAENERQFFDNDVQQMLGIDSMLPPDIPSRSKIKELGPSSLREISRRVTPSDIIYLNLFNNGIAKMEFFEDLVNMRTLILSFNEIKKIDGLDECKKLSKLDLSHNFIVNINGLLMLQDLDELNLSNNWITKLDDVDYLLKYNYKLTILSLKCNPIAIKNCYRSTVFTKLPNLQKLDQISKTQRDIDDVSNGLKEMDKALIIQFVNVSQKAVKNDQEDETVFSNAQNEDNSIIMNLNSSQTLQRLEYEEQKSSNDQWEKQVEILVINHQNIAIIAGLNEFTNLRKLQLKNNQITSIEGLDKCRLLEEVSFEKNKITYIKNLSHLTFLKKLDLGHNKIKRIEGLTNLDNLTQLSLEDNEIKSLQGLQNLLNLMELYCGNNHITEKKEVWHLKPLGKLIILDISGNAICNQEKYRIYVVYHLRKLRVLDSASIDASEMQKARETFIGRLTEDILEIRLQGISTASVKELDLSGCRLRDYNDMFDDRKFPDLRTLNLNKNYLESLKGFGFCPKLRILTLSGNRIETLFAKPGPDGRPVGLLGLVSIEVLDVSFNNLHDFYGLQFAPLKELKILNSSQNEVTKLDYLDTLVGLRELDVTRNRIRQFDPSTFMNNRLLSCIKIEENLLKSVAGIEKLERVRSLFLGSNRLTDFWQLDKLQDMDLLQELTLQLNPLAKKPLYRQTVVKRFPTLKILDGLDISPEERDRIETNGQSNQVNPASSQVPSGVVFQDPRGGLYPSVVNFSAQQMPGMAPSQQPKKTQGRNQILSPDQNKKILPSGQVNPFQTQSIPIQQQQLQNSSGSQIMNEKSHRGQGNGEDRITHTSESPMKYGRAKTLNTRKGNNQVNNTTGGDTFERINGVLYLRKSSNYKPLSHETHHQNNHEVTRQANVSPQLTPNTVLKNTGQKLVSMPQIASSRNTNEQKSTSFQGYAQKSQPSMNQSTASVINQTQGGLGAQIGKKDSRFNPITGSVAAAQAHSNVGIAKKTPQFMRTEDMINTNLIGQGVGSIAQAGNNIAGQASPKNNQQFNFSKQKR